ncbi:MAG: hypothetical protein QM676_08100 [Novosphingobium sp.]
MRLTLSALLCAAVLSSPALAGDKHRRHDDGPPPYAADMPSPPPGHGGPGYGPYGAMPMDPRMHSEWMARCGGHHGRADDDRDGPPPLGCGYRAPYGYPGAYMAYGVPMIMVPVMRDKPCKEVVEYVEEVVPVRRRVIHRPRPVVRPVPDKRIRIVPDKRVPVTPSKRIPY